MSLSMCMASTDKTTFFSTTELSLSFGTVSKNDGIKDVLHFILLTVMTPCLLMFLTENWT